MRFRAIPALLLVAVLALGACSKHSSPVAPQPVNLAPVANSPENATKRLVWTWVNRDTAAYDGLLTSDFTFAFASSDSAGNSYSGHTWGEMDERLSVGHLFAGGGALPPASNIDLAIDNQLFPNPDPRAGRDPRWHQTVRTHVDLKVTVVDGNGTPSVTPIMGYALFYLVRGDSAALSPAAIQAGGLDSTRWYLQRWEDQTVGTASPGFQTNPSAYHSLGTLKALYH